MYYAAQLKGDKQCNGCGTCILSCPEANALKLIRLGDKKKKIEVNELRCKGCGLCVELCPKKALELVSQTFSA
jgi:Pyruvate/2-oxoacid:ferredoxin oxidoreductase delta subunit